MKPKTKKSRRWKNFIVAGTNYKNNGMKLTRNQWIQKYVFHGSKFVLKREPDNEYDKNAIKIYHSLKSGKKMQIGYVPKKLAEEWAPLIDDGWQPDIKITRAFISEKDDPEKGICIGDCTGLMMRFPIR